MKMMKILLLTIYCFCSFSKSMSTADHLVKLEFYLSKPIPNQLEADGQFRKIAKNLENKFVQKDLEKTLKYYHQMFKIDSNHYVTEMFVPVFKKNKSKFIKALQKSLKKEDRDKFIHCLKISISEAENGNG